MTDFEKAVEDEIRQWAEHRDLFMRLSDDYKETVAAYWKEKLSNSG